MAEGRRPKFAMAERLATAESENFCYGPTLMQTPENVSLQLKGSPVICYLSRVAVRNGKKKSGQETGLGNRERLKVLNDTKLVLNKHE